jgi:hypothetical protein
VLSPAPGPGSESSVPLLEFTTTIGPMPGKTQVDARAFLSALAQTLGTSETNIVIVPAPANSNAGGENTVTLVLRFQEDRARLQDAFSNMTSATKQELGIEKLLAAPAATSAPEEEDRDWIFIFLALGALGIFVLVATVAFMRLRASSDYRSL